MSDAPSGRPRRIIRRGARNANPESTEEPPSRPKLTIDTNISNPTPDPIAAMQERLQAVTTQRSRVRSVRREARQAAAAVSPQHSEEEEEQEKEKPEEESNPMGVSSRRKRRPSRPAAVQGESPTTTTTVVVTPTTTLKPFSELLAPQTLKIDLAAFTRVSFSSATFVNNIAVRLLAPIIQQKREEAKAGASASSSEVNRSRLRGNDGSALFGTVSYDHFSSSRRQAAEFEEIDYGEVATALAATLEQASTEVERLLAEEEEHLQQQEVRGKRIEIKAKRQLAKVRMGLEATTQRLQLYENSVTNALSATAGIEQHLSQSNARVQRGKSVSHLLKYFKMFTNITEGELATLLKSLTKARAAQRVELTKRWQRGRVSAFNPRYFTTPVQVTSSGLKEDAELAAPKPRRVSKTEVAAPPAAEEPTGRRKKKQVFKRGGTRARMGAQGSAAASRAASRAVSRANSAENSEEDNDHAHEESEEEQESDPEEDEASLRTVKLHRAEQAVVSAGFDRQFAARVYTEQQVEWCQRLLLLAKELGDVAEHTSNISFYAAWLRQELVTDLFHVIAAFNDFYEENTDTAVHQNYGRALLKTMELIARLYADLEPTNDELLGVFFQRSVNDLGVVLFSEYSPRPLPSQPPLPGPTPRLAMDHYRETTKVELKKTFQFLMDRIKRDLIVVETVFGMTSAARQQLLSHVTDGVVKPFVMQQIKLAETHHTFMANAEATLSPRSRRKSAARVADAISYHYTMESSLFTFYQDYMKELRDLFQSSEVEFLNRFVDVIFVDRTTYAKEQPETSLLQRIFTLIEEQYTRPLHPVPGEHFDIQEAHMQKAKQMVQAMTEVAERVKVYAPPRTQGPYVLSIVQLSLKAVGKFLDEELTKTYNSLKADHDNWRLKPKSEEVLLHPPTPESQQCAFRLLLFAQSTLMSLSDAVAAVCCTLLKSAPSLLKDVAEAEAKELELLDERAEKTLNYALQAVVIRSLSILYHYQLKTDYLIKVNKSAEDTMAPPCSRACTLFCYYLTAQLRDMKEFISMSHGQLSSRVGAGNSANYNQNTKTHFDLTAAVAEIAEHNNMNNNNNNNTGREDGLTTDGLTATRTRARIMNYQQLLYGDGGPSSLVRTLGVCLYRGISVHLKSFAANDKGAFVYKQDVTAYKECLLPLTSLDGLGAAVVEVLFQILKETANLLLMPLDHIKEVKDSGLLRILPNEEKLKYIRIRQDVRDAFKVINA